MLWSHANGRDWTVAGFLQGDRSGLEVPMAGDSATRSALSRALADEPVAGLRTVAPCVPTSSTIYSRRTSTALRQAKSTSTAASAPRSVCCGCVQPRAPSNPRPTIVNYTRLPDSQTPLDIGRSPGVRSNALPTAHPQREKPRAPWAKMDIPGYNT